MGKRDGEGLLVQPRNVYVERGIGQSIEIVAITREGTRILSIAVDRDYYHRRVIEFAQEFLDDVDPQPRLTLVKRRQATRPVVGSQATAGE